MDAIQEELEELRQEVIKLRAIIQARHVGAVVVYSPEEVIDVRKLPDAMALAHLSSLQREELLRGLGIEVPL